MQYAVDIMAMVQKASIPKQKFDVPSKTTGNEKFSFKKELDTARKEAGFDKTQDSKQRNSSTPVKTENHAEKHIKQMSGNIKAESKPLKQYQSSEEQIKRCNNELDAVESPEVDFTDPAEIQNLLEMLQQLMQGIEGLNMEVSPEKMTAEYEAQINSLLQKLDAQFSMPSKDQTTQLQKTFADITTDLEELLSQLNTKPDGKTDMSKEAQIVEQLLDKLNQAKTQMHQMLQENNKKQDNGEEASIEVKEAYRLQSKEASKTVSSTNQMVQGKEEPETADKISKASEKNSSYEENKQKNETGLQKADQKATSKQYAAVDKHIENNFQESMLVQTEKLNTQLNLKQITSVLHKDSLVRINKADIINQVVKKADLIIQGDHQEMIMKLEPESLGKLNLKLVVENGLVTAKFIAESQQVKEVLESSFNQLKDMLQEKGIAVQSFSVSVGQEGSEFKSSQSFDAWKRSIKPNSSRIIGDYIELDGEMNNANPYSYHDGKIDFKA